jgi:NADH-quinone oxidoreductase subunit L
MGRLQPAALAGLAGVVLTAFYMTRLLCEVFLGRPRSPEAAHAGESPPVMTIPLAMLAIGAVFLGFSRHSGMALATVLLTGAPVPAKPLLEGGGLMAVSVVLVAAGLGAGWALYGAGTRGWQPRARSPGRPLPPASSASSAPG